MTCSELCSLTIGNRKHVISIRTSQKGYIKQQIDKLILFWIELELMHSLSYSAWCAFVLWLTMHTTLLLKTCIWMLPQDLTVKFHQCFVSIAGNFSTSTKIIDLFLVTLMRREEGFQGISKNFGHGMAFKILNTSTNEIIRRSSVKPEDYGKWPNLRADTLTSPELIKPLHHDSITSTEDNASEDDESPSSSK